MEFHLRAPGSGAVLAGLTVCGTDRRPEGGGIQSTAPCATPGRVAIQPGSSVFSDRVSLALSLSEPGQVRLSVYDGAGREVKCLHEGLLGAGRQAWTWNGDDHGGRRLPAGVYFCRVEAAGTAAVARLVLVR